MKEAVHCICSIVAKLQAYIALTASEPCCIALMTRCTAHQRIHQRYSMQHLQRDCTAAEQVAKLTACNKQLEMVLHDCSAILRFDSVCIVLLLRSST